MLKANSAIPLYHQLAERILEQIREQGLLPGDRLASEEMLGKKYQVSRITVRKAVELLVADGVLVKQQGKGTFILPNEPVRRTAEGITSFTATCYRSGMTPSTQVILRQKEMLPIWVSEFLEIPPDTTGIVLCRIRNANLTPVILEWSYFKGDQEFLLNENLAGSLHNLLQENHVVLSSCAVLPDVCLATSEEAELLQVYRGKPLLLIKAHYREKSGRPLYATKEIIVSDRFKYTF